MGLGIGFVLGVLVCVIVIIIDDRGHSVFGLKNQDVQRAVAVVVQKFTTLRFRHKIESGFTHQFVMSGGTVFAYYDTGKDRRLPSNVRTVVVWGKKRRIQAAKELEKELREAGYYEARILEPLDFPEGTFLLVVAPDAFLGCGIAFRPHWVKMIVLSIIAKMMAEKQQD